MSQNADTAAIGARVRTSDGVPHLELVAKELTHEILTAAVLSDGTSIELGARAHATAVPELAFLLREEPVGTPTVASVLAATRAVLGVLTVSTAGGADGSAGSDPVTAHVVLGPRAAPPTELTDLRLLGCVLRTQGEVVATASGAAALGNPAAAAAWLVAELAAQGRPGQPGWLLLTGGLTPPIELSPGLAVTAEFDGLGVIDLTCS